MESIAIKYADALLAIAKEENNVEEYLDANDFVVELFKTTPEFYSLLTSEFISKSERIAIVDKVLKPLNLPNYNNFIKLLIKRNRLAFYEEIIVNFRLKAKAAIGVVEGVVYSVLALKEEEITSIAEVISKRIKKTVHLTNKLDPLLLGGVKVIVGDEIYDGTLLNKIQQLKTRLDQGKAD